MIPLLQKGRLRKQFSPDYSLSFQHFCIGLFAHFLLTSKRYWFLYNAGIAIRATRDHLSLTPSWIPDCRSDASWKSVWASIRLPNPLMELTDIALAYGDAFRVILEEACLERMARTLDPAKPFHVDATVDRASGKLSINLIHMFVFVDQPSLKERCGSLNVYGLPVRDSKGQETESNLSLVVPGGLDIQPHQDHLFILDPGSGCVLGLPGKHWNIHPVTYLILREYADGPSTPNFKLITSRVRLFEGDLVLQDDMRTLQRDDRRDSESWSTVGRVSGYTLNKIRTSVATVLASIQKQMRSLKHHEGYEILLPVSTNRFFLQPEWQQFLPHVEDEDSMLHTVLVLCQALHEKREQKEERESPNTRLQRSFLACIERMFHAEVVREGDYGETFIKLTLDYQKWTARTRYYCMLPEQQRGVPTSGLFCGFENITEFWKMRNLLDKIKWEWKFESDEHWQAVPHSPGEDQYRELLEPPRKRTRMLPPEERVCVRAKINPILEGLRMLVRHTVRLYGMVVEAYDPPPDLETLAGWIKNGPTEEQTNKGVPKYIGGVRVDGSVCRVGIL